MVRDVTFMLLSSFAVMYGILTIGTCLYSFANKFSAGSRQVPELLAEQVEAADVVILNKIDLSDGEQLDTAKVVVRSLNKNAEVFETKFGELSPTQIIGNFAKSTEETNAGHSHEHSSHDEHTCSDPGCSDASHSHSHEHTSSVESTSHNHDHQSCEDPDCSNSSHSHSHAHDEACADPGCSDSSHSHSHSHDEGCGDPNCTDSSHSHSHDHKATTTANLGISNFVYKKSRPFDPKKLQRLLMSWPIPVMEELKLADLEQELAKQEDTKVKSPFVGVLRSKGFAWVAPSIMKGAYNDLDRHDTGE
jgi:G3E family GTPase